MQHTWKARVVCLLMGWMLVVGGGSEAKGASIRQEDVSSDSSSGLSWSVSKLGVAGSGGLFVSLMGYAEGHQFGACGTCSPPSSYSGGWSFQMSTKMMIFGLTGTTVPASVYWKTWAAESTRNASVMLTTPCGTLWDGPVSGQMSGGVDCNLPVNQEFTITKRVSMRYFVNASHPRDEGQVVADPFIVIHPDYASQYEVRIQNPGLAGEPDWIPVTQADNEAIWNELTGLAEVPEASGMVLVGCGLAALMMWRRQGVRP